MSPRVTNILLLSPTTFLLRQRNSFKANDQNMIIPLVWFNNTKRDNVSVLIGRSPCVSMVISALFISTARLQRPFTNELLGMTRRLKSSFSWDGVVSVVFVCKEFVFSSPFSRWTYIGEQQSKRIAK